jgi:hypothetical protein
MAFERRTAVFNLPPTRRRGENGLRHAESLPRFNATPHCSRGGVSGFALSEARTAQQTPELFADSFFGKAFEAQTAETVGRVPL